MPAEPPGFDPCPFLDEELRHLYLQPSAHSAPMLEAPAAPPRVQVRAFSKAENSLELLSMLDRAGRLKLCDASLVDFTKACGLFAIPKGVDADRLIVDGRPANLCVDVDTRWLCTLALASNLLDVELVEGEELRMSGEDVKDYTTTNSGCPMTGPCSTLKLQYSLFKVYSLNIPISLIC